MHNNYTGSSTGVNELVKAYKKKAMEKYSGGLSKNKSKSTNKLLMVNVIY